jgi:hypothetical protein
MENLETPKKRGWSIVRKAQVVTTVIGVFVTTVILILNYCRLIPPSAVNASWFPAFNFFGHHGVVWVILSCFQAS